jgi:hypothetical protein
LPRLHRAGPSASLDKSINGNYSLIGAQRYHIDKELSSS